LSRKAVHEDFIGGGGDSGHWRAGRTRDLDLIGLESSAVGHNRVVDGSLDSRAVEKTNGAAMRGAGVYDSLNGDLVPVRYCIGTYY
jgi:hypothetical protein